MGRNKKIRTIKDYFDWLYKDAPECTMYYRGQANSRWDIVAGVFRDSESSEHELLEKASLRLSNELSKFPTCLEKLIYLQHYGMKTRLLDVTTNPLVALFFACSEYKEKGRPCDGVVYRGVKGINENPEIARLTADFVFNTHPGVANEYYYKDKKKNKSEFSTPIFIFPPINNPRIEHQNGAFIMTPLEGMCSAFDPVDTSDNSKKDNIDRSHSLRGRFDLECPAIIDKSSKMDILRELYVLGIDDGFISQDITGKINAIIRGVDYKNLAKRIILTE